VRLVFDLGGVVFRWRPDEFLTRLLPARAPSAAAARALAARFFEGFGGDWGEFDRGRIEVEALAGRIATRLGFAPDEARRVIDAIPDELQPIPDTVALLRRLRGRHGGLSFLSNMPLPYASHLEATHDVFECFDGGVFSSRVGLIKPEPAMFAHAARQFRERPADHVHVDDIQGNVEAARAAGWRALRFEDAAQCAAGLEALGIA
jgi:putative hydrolase of the HAD superfamily